MGIILRDHDELAQRLRGLRDGGKRVVFTNGCFDLLHVGHIRCLIDAAKRGDFLVVALNSDASIRKLKGPDRPVQPEAERAEILAALNGVAYVTIFHEETCGPLLRKLRPQLVAKGTDYSLETLPEREVLAEIGAELILVGDPKDHSTVDLLARIRGQQGASGPGAPRRVRKVAAPAAAKTGGKPGKKAGMKSAKPLAKAPAPKVAVKPQGKPLAKLAEKGPARAAKEAVAKALAARVAAPAAAARKSKAAAESHG
ncbi:MAG: adenylyltransferase/cytidyltransferase family protein [Planctomycetes bacterium]|nr:adenylyltransferase/cytidyltransferase family protein [Planctomycetota bacterium]